MEDLRGGERVMGDLGGVLGAGVLRAGVCLGEYVLGVLGVEVR